MASTPLSRDAKQLQHDAEFKARKATLQTDHNITSFGQINAHIKDATNLLYILYGADQKAEDKAIAEIQRFKARIDDVEFKDLPLLKRNAAKRFIDRIDKNVPPAGNFVSRELSKCDHVAIVYRNYIQEWKNISMRQVLAIMWIAMHDEKQLDAEKITEAEMKFINQAYEINRAYNIKDHPELENTLLNDSKRKETDDEYSCTDGTSNRLILSLDKIHPLVNIKYINQGTIEFKTDAAMREIFKDIFRALDPTTRAAYLSELKHRDVFDRVKYVTDIMPEFQATVLIKMKTEFGKNPLSNPTAIREREGTETIVKNYMQNSYLMTFPDTFLEELNALHEQLKQGTKPELSPDAKQALAKSADSKDEDEEKEPLISNDIISFIENDNDRDLFNFLNTPERDKELDLYQALLHFATSVEKERNRHELHEVMLDRFTAEIRNIRRNIPQTQLPLLTELIYRTTQYVKDHSDLHRPPLNENTNTQRLRTLATEMQQRSWGKAIGGIVIGIIGLGLIATAICAAALTGGALAPLASFVATIGMDLVSFIIASSVSGAACTLGGMLYSALASTSPLKPVGASAMGLFGVKAPHSAAPASERQQSSIALAART